MQVISADRDKKIINGNEFRVIGMSRSGNHAIINWIIQQVKGRYCFLNCVEPKTNPFCTSRPLSHDITYLTNYDEFDLTAEQEGLFSVKDYLIYSYEDCFLGMVCGDEFEERHDEFVGCSRRRIDILILRDPFNLFAGMRFDGRAGEMRVLERWRYFADQLSFQVIFDPEMVGLSNEIFGHLSGTERLLSL